MDSGIKNKYFCSVKNGEFRQYRGSRDKDSLIAFIEEKKWKEVEPVSAWKHPNSVQMSLVSSFFKVRGCSKLCNTMREGCIARA